MLGALELNIAPSYWSSVIAPMKGEGVSVLLLWITRSPISGFNQLKEKVWMIYEWIVKTLISAAVVVPSRPITGKTMTHPAASGHTLYGVMLESSSINGVLISRVLDPTKVEKSNGSWISCAIISYLRQLTNFSNIWNLLEIGQKNIINNVQCLSQEWGEAERRAATLPGHFFD